MAVVAHVLLALALFAGLGIARGAEDAEKKGGGWYKVGAPYEIRGQWYTPAEDASYREVGIASWYGSDFHGRKTANGEVYDMNALTAAHKTLPMPSYVRVTNRANGRVLLLRVNDRGPFIDGRIIDLSREAARLLGFEQQGHTNVDVAYVGPAPIDGNDQLEQSFLANQDWRTTPERHAARTVSPIQSDAVTLATTLKTGSVSPSILLPAPAVPKAPIAPEIRRAAPKMATAKKRPLDDDDDEDDKPVPATSRGRAAPTAAGKPTSDGKRDDRHWRCAAFSNCHEATGDQ